ncbi:hypothetical protein STAS_24236 [Striga asiatica]|uniref:Uncharacterized protein n=1 Tax=Striga asiatica TaxID=4170 RepID=A0A5A7QT77_STRAF|nr:hypothetical protein STAS_24236 [Striga asiatica]
MEKLCLHTFHTHTYTHRRRHHSPRPPPAASDLTQLRPPSPVPARFRRSPSVRRPYADRHRRLPSATHHTPQNPCRRTRDAPDDDVAATAERLLHRGVAAGIMLAGELGHPG